MDGFQERESGLELGEDTEFFGLGSSQETEDDFGEFGESSEIEFGTGIGDFEGSPSLEGLEDDEFDTEGFGDLPAGSPYATGGADYQVIAPDTRRRILGTRRRPWRYIVKIDPPGCTGTLIAPNKVVTAAHCVYNRTRRSKYSGIRVIPAKNGTREPFGSARATRVDFPSQYASASSYTAAWQHDYAVITLDKPIGRKVGWWKQLAAIPSSKLTRLRLNTAGYPGDKGGKHLYWTYNKVISVRGSRIEYLLDTFGGQSGSPVWLRWKSRRILVAIHTARDDAGTPGATPIVANRGVAITPTILRQIRSWMRS